MRIRYYIRNIMVIAGVSMSILSNTFVRAELPNIQIPPNLGITEDDLKKAEEEVEAFRMSLPPEERDKWDKDVQEFTKALETMSESELEEFFTQMMTTEENMFPKSVEPTPTPTPTPVPASQPKPEPAKDTPPKKGDTRPAEQLIEGIVASIDNFARKIYHVVDIDQKFKNWRTKGTVVKDDLAPDWYSFTNNVEQFKQKVLKLVDKDQKTKEFRYLNDLIENKKLYEELSVLKNDLLTYEQNIIASPTVGALKTLNSNNRAFVLKFINTITATLRTKKIDEQIVAVFAKYEPVAKAIEESEKQRGKRAAETAKKTPSQEPARVYGKTPTYTPQSDGGYDRSSGGGYSGGGYTGGGRSFEPSSIGSRLGTGTSEPSSKTAAADLTTRTPSTTSASAKSSTQTSSPAKTQEEELGIKTKAKAEKEKAATAKAAKSTDSTSVEIQRTEQAYEKAWEKISKIFESSIIPLVQPEKGKEYDLGKVLRDNLELANKEPNKIDLNLVKQLVAMEGYLKDIAKQFGIIKTAFGKLPTQKKQVYLKADQKRVAAIVNHKLMQSFFSTIREITENAEKQPVRYNTNIKYAFFADETAKPDGIKPLEKQANIPNIFNSMLEIGTAAAPFLQPVAVQQ